MGLLDTLRNAVTNLLFGELMPVAEAPKGYGKMYAYFVTTWIGNGKEWRNMWWCSADGWRREWTEEETKELNLRQAYEYFVGILEVGEETDGAPLTEEHRVAIIHAIEDALTLLPRIAEPFIYPKCGRCGKETQDWQTAMGNLLVSHQLYPNEGPQRVNLPDYVGYWEDITGQYVKLSDNIPSPNIVVVKVGELREKHRGSLSQLSLDICGMMLERQWKTDDPMTSHVQDGSLKTWLETQGLSKDEPVIAKPERTKKLITLAQRCGPP